jgi:hypothetical protein
LFIKGDYSDSEWRGSIFDPRNGGWLFVNAPARLL